MGQDKLTSELIQIHKTAISESKQWIQTASDIMINKLKKNDEPGLNFYARTILQAQKDLHNHRSSLMYLLGCTES